MWYKLVPNNACCLFLFQSYSCQCEMLDRKVLVSPVIKILYLHGEITATQSQMKILRKEIRKIIFHCICHSFFAKIIWHLYNIWLIIKAKPLSEAGVKMVIFTQNMRTRSGFWTRAHPVMFYLSNWYLYVFRVFWEMPECQKCHSMKWNQNWKICCSINPCQVSG